MSDIFAYKTAIGEFEMIPGWKDADEKLAFCRKKIEEITAKKEREAEARRIASDKTAKKLKKIIIIAAPIVFVCIVFLIVLTTVIIPNGKYNAAVTLMEEENYEEAISAFEAMDGYKDSAEKIDECNTAIQDGKYNAAVALMNDGKYDDAISAFEAMNGYKDSEKQLENCYIGKYGEEKWEKIKNTKVGDTYTFGAYEQDDNTSNGKEAIEWTVLDRDDMSLLLISKYALDCQPYNTTFTNVTWATCSLQTWLNDTFLTTAFNAEELAQIQNTKVWPAENPEYGTWPGSAKTNKVFLLSITEAEQYFSSDSARECKPTSYATANGANVYRDNGNCWWWLRSPGGSQHNAAVVHSFGSVSYSGYYVYDVDVAVRPALWINLDS